MFKLLNLRTVKSIKNTPKSHCFCTFLHTFGKIWQKQQLSSLQSSFVKHTMLILANIVFGTQIVLHSKFSHRSKNYSSFKEKKVSFCQLCPKSVCVVQKMSVKIRLKSSMSYDWRLIFGKCRGIKTRVTALKAKVFQMSNCPKESQSEWNGRDQVKRRKRSNSALDPY